MSVTIFLCLLAGLVATWSCLWVYMLHNLCSNELEEVKKKLNKLEVEFHQYRIDNPPRD